MSIGGDISPKLPGLNNANSSGTGNLKAANNLSDVNSAATSRTNLNVPSTSTDINSSGIVTKTNNVSFATSATTDTTNASNISSGTLSTSRLTTTGSGNVVLATSPVLTTPTEKNPTIADSTDTTKNIQFTLSGATTAKTLTISSSHTLARTMTIPDATGTIVYKDTTDTLTNKTLTSPTMTTPILGTPTSGTLTNCSGYTDANLSVSNITTNNVSTSAHGFAPIAPNDATKYLDGTGAYSTPAGGGGSGSVLTSSTTLTQSQIQNLASTPITLITAPGAGKLIRIVSVLASYTFNTSAFSSGGTLSIRWGTSLSMISMPATLITSTSSDFLIATINEAAGNPTSSAVNTAATILSTVNFTGGNASSTLKLFILYTIETL